MAKIHEGMSGDQQIVENGGVITIKSGGRVDIREGGGIITENIATALGLDTQTIQNLYPQSVQLSGLKLPRLTRWCINGVSGRKIAIVGDSTAAQKFNSGGPLHTADGDTIVKHATQTTGILYGVTFQNFGANGATIAAFAAGAAGNNVNISDIIGFAPDLILFTSYGINDGRIGTTAAAITASYRTAISLLRASLPNVDILIQIPHTLSESGNSQGVPDATNTYYLNGATAQTASDAIRSGILALEGMFSHCAILDFPSFFMGTASLPVTGLKQTVTLSRSGSTVTGTTIAAAPHNLLTGDKIQITGATPATYNIGATVASTPTASTFTFALGDSSATTPPTGTISVAPVPISVTDQLHLAATGYGMAMELIAACICPNGTDRQQKLMADDILIPRCGSYAHARDNNRLLFRSPSFDPLMFDGNPDFFLLARGQYQSSTTGTFVRFKFNARPGDSRAYAALQVGDIVVQDGGAAWLINSGSAFLISSTQIQINSTNVLAQSGGYVAVYRHKYALSKSAMDAIFLADVNYPITSARFFQIITAGNGFMDIYNLTNELDVKVVRFSASDVLYVPNVPGVTTTFENGLTLSSATFPVSGNLIRILKSGTNFTGLAGYQCMIASSDTAKYSGCDNPLPIGIYQDGVFVTTTIDQVITRNSVFNTFTASLGTSSSVGACTIVATLNGAGFGTATFAQGSTTPSYSVFSAGQTARAGDKLKWVVTQGVGAADATALFDI